MCLSKLYERQILQEGPVFSDNLVFAVTSHLAQRPYKIKVSMRDMTSSHALFQVDLTEGKGESPCNAS